VNQPEKPSVFGRSLQLTDGDLLFDQGTLVTVAGRDNFLQAMQVMIETPFATDIFNVKYGFDLLSILGSAQSVRLSKELIRLNIVKSVSQDNRVREIKEVVFNDDPRFFEILPDQNADEHRRTRKIERRWQAIVVLETISEGEVALRLEGTGLRT
jgi:hypothetical protein